MGQPTRIPLLHTALHMPHDRLTVTSLDERDTDTGVAFTATLCLDGTPVGVIHNDGHGGATWLRHDDPDRFDQRDMRQFVLGCRYRHQPTDEETVLDRLVAEYDLTTRTAALPPRTTVARSVDVDGDYCGDVVTIASDAPDPLDTPAGHAALAIYLATVPTSPCCAGWQVWRYGAWHRVPPLIGLG
ncbi:hypothetical protein [Micromonospora violae]|uniref:hypothetical protein n=1 Tax=Micromonospora violae TaxID=1278207 RepID=UPI0033D43072